jgi:DNA-binding response OmpR family regulator
MTGGRNDESAFFYVLSDAVHILFVDDDPIMREFATVHLATDKAEVAIAGDGLEALDAIAARAPDIVLLDLEMPNLDGFDTLVRLRADPATQDLPVIVVTGREDARAIDRAFDVGATSFLVKPINWRLLSYQIRYVLRAGRAEARGEAARAPTSNVSDQALLSLAREGAALVRLAMTGGPELRRSAIEYASLLADTVGPRALQRGHG